MNVLHFDPDCALCAGWARRLERWGRGRLALAPARGELEVRLVEAGGRETRGFAVLVRLTAVLPALAPLWPVVRLPGMSYAGPRLYEALAVARFRLSERLAGR